MDVAATDGDGHRSSAQFETPGTFPYYCELHPTMRGDIGVHRVLLSAPREPAAPGKPYALSGRAALPAGSTVSIQADGGVAATATVDDHGAFTAAVNPAATTTYTAVAGGESGPPVQVLVLDRKVSASAAFAQARHRDCAGHAGLDGRHRRAAAQAQGALRLVAGADRENGADSRVRFSSRVGARSPRASC